MLVSGGSVSLAYRDTHRNEVGGRSKQDTDSENDCIPRRQISSYPTLHRENLFARELVCPSFVSASPPCRVLSFEDRRHVDSHRWSDKVDLVRVIARGTVLEVVKAREFAGRTLGRGRLA
jgi:hypothetical protein